MKGQEMDETMMDRELDDAIFDDACSILLDQVDQRQMAKQKVNIISSVVVKTPSSKLERILTTARSAVTCNSVLFYGGPSTSVAEVMSASCQGDKDHPEATLMPPYPSPAELQPATIGMSPPPPQQVKPATTKSRQQQQQSQTSPVFPRKKKTLKRQCRQDASTTSEKKQKTEEKESAPKWLIGIAKERRSVVAAAYKVKCDLKKN